LDFRGTWDESTESGNSPNVAVQQSRVNLTFIDCDFSGIGKIISGNIPQDAAEADCSMWLFDCSMTTFRDYGILSRTAENIWVVLLGTRLTRAANASGDGRSAKDYQANWHGPVRISNLKVLVCRANHIYSRSGHPGGGGAQPCMRIGTDNEGQTLNGTERAGFWSAYISQNLMEGGAIIINTSTENGGNPVLPANVIIRHNIFLGDYQTKAGIGVCRGATTVEGNIVCYPDISLAVLDRNATPPALATGQTRSNWVALADNNVTMPTENTDEPVRIIGNTLIDYKTTSDTGDIPSLANFAGAFTGRLEIRDNVEYRPNHGTPDTSDGPMQALVSITSLNTFGGRWPDTYGVAETNFTNFTTGLDSKTLITPSGVFAIVQPTVGGAAAGAATGATLKFDIFGTQQLGDASIGALVAAGA
jgi:hypothetical protein